LEIRALTYALPVFCAGRAALSSAFAQTPADVRQVATQALDHAIIIDTHADTPQALPQLGRLSRGGKILEDL
jgi:hypothetical protein